MTGANSEIQNKTLGKAQRILQKMKGCIEGKRGLKERTRKWPTDSKNQSSQSITENDKTITYSAWDLH